MKKVSCPDCRREIYESEFVCAFCGGLLGMAQQGSQTPTDHSHQTDPRPRQEIGLKVLPNPVSNDPAPTDLLPALSLVTILVSGVAMILSASFTTCVFDFQGPLIATVALLVGGVSGFLTFYMTRPVATELSNRKKGKLVNDLKQKSIIEANELTRTCQTIIDELTVAQLALPSYLSPIDTAISRAWHEFQNQAYGRCYDTIGQITGALNAYHAAVGKIVDLASSYYQLLQGRKHTFPKLEVDPDKLGVPQHCEIKLQELFDAADHNPVCTQIWEQKKTREALSDLHHSITALNSQMRSQIGELTRVVESGFVAQTQAIQHVGEEIQNVDRQISGLRSAVDVNTIAGVWGDLYVAGEVRRRH
ncbi:MAG: hypothetical protein HY318_11185 [Armatimonadetes bacterium]|nr:hypothetical protein [Armatimonadota bacterium]